MKSVRSWTPSWTDTADLTTGYTTWYSGWVMKGQTRKHHGYQPRTSPMHQNFAKCSTSNTWISRGHRTANRSHNSHHITVQQTFHKFLFLSLSFFLSFSLSPFPSLLISKCPLCVLFPMYHLSCFHFLLTHSLFSFPTTILHHLITPTPRNLLFTICIILITLITLPHTALHIHPLLSLLHGPTPTCPPMC